MGTHPIFESDFDCLTEIMSDRKRLGLSLEKDGGYSKLIVFMSAVLSGFTFGLPGFLGALTVEWKNPEGLNLPHQKADIHQVWTQGFLYAGSMVVSAYYQVMSPRHWLFISSLTGTAGWLLLYSASYAPVEYFHYFQYGFGVLAGIGSGFAFGLIILTPQHWLDKTREQLNPYLFIGAPIVVVFCVTLGKVSIDNLGWANAILGVVGFFSFQWIITFFYIEHPDTTNEQDEEKPSLSETFNRYLETIQMKGVLAFLLNCAICSGVIMTAVFTKSYNAAEETGCTPWQATTLLLWSAIPEAVLFRPLWGLMTKYVDVGALQMVWMTIWLSSQLVLSFADQYWQFIAGMILFACGVSGYSGLKYVIHYDLVGGKYMQYIIAYDTALAALTSIAVPSLVSALSDDVKFIFYLASGAAFVGIGVSFYLRTVLQALKVKAAAEEMATLMEKPKTEDQKTDNGMTEEKNDKESESKIQTEENGEKTD